MAITAKITQKGMGALENFITKSGPRMAKANEAIARKMAKEAAAYAKNLIRTQNFEGAAVALTEEYRRRKRGSKKDMVLISSGNFLKAIGAFQVGKNSWTVGILKGTKIGDTDYYLLALMHEFGTQTMPARPMWKDVERFVDNRLPQVMGEAYGRLVIGPLAK